MWHREGALLLGQGHHPPVLVQVHCVDGPEETFAVNVGFYSVHFQCHQTSAAVASWSLPFVGSSLQEAAPLSAGQTRAQAGGLYAGVRAGKSLSLSLCKPVRTLLLTRVLGKDYGSNMNFLYFLVFLRPEVESVTHTKVVIPAANRTKYFPAQC